MSEPTNWPPAPQLQPPGEVVIGARQGAVLRDMILMILGSIIWVVEGGSMLAFGLYPNWTIDRHVGAGFSGRGAWSSVTGDLLYVAFGMVFGVCLFVFMLLPSWRTLRILRAGVRPPLRITADAIEFVGLPSSPKPILWSDIVSISRIGFRRNRGTRSYSVYFRHDSPPTTAMSAFARMGAALSGRDGIITTKYLDLTGIDWDREIEPLLLRASSRSKMLRMQ